MRKPNPRFRLFFTIISTIVFFTLLYDSPLFQKWSTRSIVHVKNRRIILQQLHLPSLNNTATSNNMKDGKLLLDLQICSDFLDHKGYNTSCDFLIANPDCSSAGFFNYIKFFSCSCQNHTLLAYFVLAVWLALLFYLLGNTAADYFCCSLENLSAFLNMSPTIAGVTLLPLGNGASDVFASIAAFMGTGSSAVGMNGVLGGAVFITCIVAGVVSLSVSSKRVKIDKTSFIRDLCFLIFTILCLTLIIGIGKITVWGALAFLSIYLVYIGYVSVSEMLNRKGKGLKSSDFTPLLPVAGEEPIDNEPLLLSHGPEEISGKQGHNHCMWDINFAMYSDYVKSTTEDYCPRALWGWSDNQEEQPSLSLSQLCSWLEMPLSVPRRLTIPIVEEDRWSKMYAVASALLAPVLLAFLWNTQKRISPLNGKIAYFVGFGIGLVLSVLASLYTKMEHPPRKFLFPWIFGGFFMSIIWFYIIASELVSLLVSLGTILGINPSMLALTVLAWGNSMNDLMSNTAFAMNERDGVQIAMSGCFAGPMFNTLVGLGMSLVFGACSVGSEPYVIPRDMGLFVTLAFLMTGVVWSLIVLPQSDMRPNKVLGIGLIVIYVLFLSIRISMAIRIGSP